MKTSGVARATSEDPVVSSACAADTAVSDGGNDSAVKQPTIRFWRVTEISETRFMVRQWHHRLHGN